MASAIKLSQIKVCFITKALVLFHFAEHGWHIKSTLGEPNMIEFWDSSEELDSKQYSLEPTW